MNIVCFRPRGVSALFCIEGAKICSYLNNALMVDFMTKMSRYREKILARL